MNATTTHTNQKKKIQYFISYSLPFNEHNRVEGKKKSTQREKDMKSEGILVEKKEIPLPTVMDFSF